MTIRSLRAHAACLLLPFALTLASTPGAAAEPEPPILAAARDAMWWGDFAALETQNAQLSKPGRIGADGVSELSRFRDGVALVFEYKVKNPEPYMKELDLLTLEWATRHPGSGLAHALHARALLAHAQSYRGRSTASEVPPEAWAPYQDYLKQAATYLMDHADVALTDSYSHFVLISIGRHLGWSPEQLAAVVEAGLARNPEDEDLHFAMAYTLLPKWHGDARILDAYIRHATEQTRARFGWGMYARLYAEALQDQFGTNLFENSFAEWSKMKQGYEDLQAKYPASPKRLNRYAFLACVAKGKPTFLRVIEQVGTNLHTGEWGANPERAVETCRRWAAEVDDASPRTPPRAATAT